MESTTPIPPLCPADRALLLALTDPRADSAGSCASGASHPLPDPLALAHFLARPDIRPHLEALEFLRRLRAEIERAHLARQAANLLLDVARQTTDLVEKRLAATAILRLLLGSPARAPREGAGGRASATSSPNRTGAPIPSEPHRAPTAAPHSRQPRIDGPQIDDPQIDEPQIDHPQIDEPRIDGPQIAELRAQARVNHELSSPRAADLSSRERSPNPSSLPPTPPSLSNLPRRTRTAPGASPSRRFARSSTPSRVAALTQAAGRASISRPPGYDTS